MFCEPSTVAVRHGDPFALTIRSVELFKDGPPHEAGGRIARRGWLAANAEHSANEGSLGRTSPPKQHDGRCAVSGNERARGVDHVSEVDGGKKLLDERAPKLALHEAVGNEC